MKLTPLIQEGHSRLLLFFAGWAADATPFRQYRPQLMDYAVVYDYRDLRFDPSFMDRYSEVHVLGWSMGVWAAGRVLASLTAEQRARIVTTTAFAGSQQPIDDHEGIPTATFDATLRGLTPAGLQKFLRRMCGSSTAYRTFMEVTPRRDFGEIHEELRRIGEQVEAGEQSVTWTYDRAYIGTNDLIFPAANLQTHYRAMGCPEVLTMDCAHYDESLFRYLLQERWADDASVHTPS